MTLKKATIHDIAKQLGMSASTVSRALSNNPRISAETKKNVIKMAKKLGYQPNILASNLRTGKSKAIGLIVPRINRFFFADTIAGIETVTNPAGYSLVICQSDEKLKNEIENIRTLINSRVDGIIISVSNETVNGKHLEVIKEAGIPLVQFDRTTNDIEVHQVVNDNFGAAYEATSHLIGSGYKRIAHFAGTLNNTIYCDRMGGYIKALEDHNIPIDESIIFKDAASKEGGIESAKAILAMTNRPDAVFSAGDFSAMGAYIVLKEAGIIIPQQMGIFGFANEVFAEFIDPPLSSVHQFGEEMGKTAAKILIEEIESPSLEFIPKTVVIKPKIIIRKSALLT